MKRMIALALFMMLTFSFVGCANGVVQDLPGLGTDASDACPYCGDLRGGDRWFIAKVTSSHLVMPLGEDCFEATAAGDAGISVNVSSYAVGDTVRITYGGEIMESYPVQIHAISIEIVE